MSDVPFGIFRFRLFDARNHNAPVPMDAVVEIRAADTRAALILLRKCIGENVGYEPVQESPAASPGTTFERIRPCVAAAFGVKPFVIAPETTFGELCDLDQADGCDDRNHDRLLTIVQTCETIFTINLHDDEANDAISGMVDIRDLAAIIEARLPKSSAA